MDLGKSPENSKKFRHILIYRMSQSTALCDPDELGMRGIILKPQNIDSAPPLIVGPEFP